MNSVRLERLMSLTRGEFLASITHVGGLVEAAHDLWAAPLADGQVSVRFTSRSNTRLGGLLDLPQASVVIEFTGVTSEQQEVFLRRFDIAFQRGGG